MTAASTSDILRAVERWARTTDRWAIDAPWRKDEPFIFVEPSGIGPSGRPCCIRYGPVVADGRWYVNAPVALAWALLVESGAASVDVGRCPACGGSGWVDLSATRCVGCRDCGGTDLQASADLSDVNIDTCADGIVLNFRDDAPHVVEPFGHAVVVRTATSAMPAWWLPGTGRETIPAERLLLDAVSGDTTARDRLLVHADQLLERADPLGTLLAWALGPWLGGPTEPIVRTFKGPSLRDGREQMMCDRWTVRVTGPSGMGPTNSDPEWSGTATSSELGHLHAAEAVAWLDRLTDECVAAEDEADDERRLDLAFEREREWLARRA